MNYAIYLEAGADYFPVFILEGDEEEDVDACFDDFKTMAIEEGVSGTFFLVTLADKDVEELEASIYQYLEDRPNLIALVNRFLETIDACDCDEPREPGETGVWFSELFPSIHPELN